MKVLLKDCKFYSDVEISNCNVEITDGFITNIGSFECEEADLVISNKSFSNGWVDIQTGITEPGDEYKDDLETLNESAIAGGFTHLFCLPNTHPVLDSKEALSFVKSKTADFLTDFHCVAAVTQRTNGKDLTEIHDLVKNGAIAFSDGRKGQHHSGIVLKGLQYFEEVGKRMIIRPFDSYLSSHGLVHEGKESTLLGMKGIPSVAEIIAIQKDLSILEYVGGSVHFSGISTKESVVLIKDAKAKGLDVTCDVYVHNLILTDSSISTFDTNYKLFPPLRSAEDRDALIVGVKEGVIDCIATDHNPQDYDAKILEFDYAEFGIIGLESIFGLLNTIHGFSTDLIIDKICHTPRKLFKINTSGLQKGSRADFTIFEENTSWVFDQKDIKSKSCNSPFVGACLKGKVLGVINNNKVSIKN